MKQYSPEEAKQLIEIGKLFVLDIREPWEYAICNIGGKHVPMHEVPNLLNIWTDGQEVLVVCKTGKRAEAVTNYLSVSIPKVHFSLLNGGITAWYAAYEPSFEMY